MGKQLHIGKVMVLSALAVLLSGLSACSRKVGPTTIEVVDSLRHYYPIVAGEELMLSYYVKNVGKEPFVIDDIQPSCGCIAVDDDEEVIPPGDSLLMHFTYDSVKNIGYVRHTIRIFGNASPRGVVNLVFDVNVVPPSVESPDYEEQYYEERRKGGDIEDAVNGKSSEKGYYVDINQDSRSHKLYPWRE